MWLVIFCEYFSSDCERSGCVHGYHIYKDIWDAVIGEELQCEREPNTNRNDWYAVTIRIITGHLSCKYHKPLPFI